MRKILLLDNYDSFTYNLVQIIRDLGFERTLTVKRNTEVNLEYVASFDKILLSPGPGLPVESGEMMNIIKEYKNTKSILGVCLGHQGIGEVFGAKLVNLTEVLHGIASTIIINQPDPIFHQVPERFIACHYHSWVIDPQSVNGDLDVIAIDDKENIMAIRHKHFDTKGVQFHPESILTEHGHIIINNWLTN